MEVALALHQWMKVHGMREQREAEKRRVLARFLNAYLAKGFRKWNGAVRNIKMEAVVAADCLRMNFMLNHLHC
jgi:hypothetical protein